MLFGGYGHFNGSFIWGVWPFHLGDMVVIFGGCGSVIVGVWPFYLGIILVSFGGYCSSI